MQQKHNRAFDQNIMFDWQAQVAGAAGNPSLKQQLLTREAELMPRFAAHYQKLRALPRRMRRTLQRQWKRSLACVALLLALGQAPASAAVIKVGGACTLIRAIVAANNATTATGHCTQGSAGANTVVLPAKSVVSLTTINDTTYGSSGLEGFRPQFSDLVPSQPLAAVLKPTLANNGGPTLTHALVPGSVAIDAVNDGTCPPPATDQRGIRRPRDGNGDGGPACDIGSFER